MKRDAKIFFSQALMRDAITHYLNNVLLKSGVTVNKVELSGRAKTLNEVDHFDVTFTLSEEGQ